MDDSHLDYIILNPASFRAPLCCLVSEEERCSCVLSLTGRNRHEFFQPWNLSYSAGSHLLFLLFTHYNRRQRYRGRLWRLQLVDLLCQSAAGRMLSINVKNTPIQNGYVFCCTNYELCLILAFMLLIKYVLIIVLIICQWMGNLIK